MSGPAFITAREVAPLVGYTSPVSFLKDRPRLERDLAFPPPMPTSRRPLRWRRDAVEAWAEQQGRPEPQITPDPGGNVVLMQEARTA